MNDSMNIVGRAARLRQLVAVLVLALAAVMLLAACQEEKVVVVSRYWVPGLKLPEGSEELASGDRKALSEFDKAPGKKLTQTVHFSNPAGWDRVAGEMYGHLWKLGYQEIGSQALGIEQMTEYDPGSFEAKKGSYDFRRRNTDYIVTIQHDRAMTKKASDEGRYTIVISKPPEDKR